jgi:hypothetical protein
VKRPALLIRADLRIPMKFRLSIFLFSFVIFAPVLCAQSAEPPRDEQNETMRDTLKRMQIKREEAEHKKLLEKGVQIRDNASALAKEAVGDSLPRSSEKRLREIEKFARQIRSDFGGLGGDDDPLEVQPGNLADTLKELGDSSDRLNKALEKTSRHVISLGVIKITNEISQLTKLLRNYLF